MTEKSKTKLILFLIIIVALHLRLIGIIKPGGLWYDEIEGYYNAAAAFPFGILANSIHNSIQPPLYFLFLHLWMKIFGSADTFLRLFSVLWGVLTVPVGYLIGKELKNKSLGLILSSFIAINSLLIYYSQEVRFYSLFIFVIGLSILFNLRIFKNPNKKNYIGLILSNVACLYTASLGAIFVFIQAIAAIIHLYSTNRKEIRNFIKASIITAIIYLPYLAITLHHISILNNSFIGLFDWGKFYPMCIPAIIQDWFTPELINIYNYPGVNFYTNLLSQGIPIFYFIFVFFVIFIYLFGIFKAIVAKNKEMNTIFLIGVAIFLVEIILSSMGKFNMVSRYTMIIGFLFIITSVFGLCLIKNKFVKSSFIIYILISSIFFIYISPISAPKRIRNEGLGFPAQILTLDKATQDDFIIMPFGGRYISKYASNNEFNVADFDLVKTYFASEDKQLSNVMDEKLYSELNIKNAREKLQSYIGDTEPSEQIVDFVQNMVIKKMKKGSRLFLVSSTGINLFSKEDLKFITQNNENYKKQSLLYMLASKNTNDIMDVCNSNLTQDKYIQAKLWDIYIWKK